MSATDIAGYTYNADNLCAHCTLIRLAHGKISPGEIGFAYDEHKLIRFVGACMGIDVYDERSYDSDEFPKVIFSSHIESKENCANCNEELI